jgi:hypothetical protein
MSKETTPPQKPGMPSQKVKMLGIFALAMIKVAAVLSW